MANTTKVFETAFDTYTVVRQVGAGGSGVVFLVKNSDGQDFALKVLDRSKTPRHKVKRFQNEIQFCQRQASVDVAVECASVPHQVQRTVEYS